MAFGVVLDYIMQEVMGGGFRSSEASDVDVDVDESGERVDCSSCGCA